MSLNLRQSSEGYRYSIDAFLLADFCLALKGVKILELGSGCGIISILLAKSCPYCEIVGIEIQADLIELAEQNLLSNKLSSSIRFIQGDIRQIPSHFSDAPFDVIVTNPPYHKVGSGRVNPHPGRASARHEITGSLTDFIQAGVHILRTKGYFYMIYTANRLPELIHSLVQNELEPKVIKFIHPRKNSEANLVLIKTVKKGRPGLRILPPIFIYKTIDEYSNEVKCILKRWRFV